MKKLAFFVEGLTEQLFVEHLLLQVANANDLVVEKRDAYGGGESHSKRRLRLIEVSKPDTGARYSALIVDCKNDDRVASDIRDRYDGLSKAGYSAIIGIRDVYPNSRDQIPLLRQNLPKWIPTKPTPVSFILAIMEIESWFLAEHTHFKHIDPRLTPETVADAAGFNPVTSDVQLRDHPAADLNRIYERVGQSYQKHHDIIERTLNVLDYGNIYLHMGDRFPDFRTLATLIDNFLS